MPLADRLSWLIAAGLVAKQRVVGRVAERSGRVVGMLSPSIGGSAWGPAATLEGPLDSGQCLLVAAGIALSYRPDRRRFPVIP